MSVVIIRQDGKIDAWKDELEKQAGDITFYSYLEPHPKENIEVAMVWKHPSGILKQYPALKYIASFGAGVDFLLDDPDIGQIPITRVVDPFLAGDMAEFVIGAILAHLKNFHQYTRDQQQGIWKPLPYQRNSETTVGIMGLGVLGTKLAEELNKLDFNVLGWSTSSKSIDNVTSYIGEDGKSLFLSQSHILVCLLPLTDQTKGIINKSLLSQLPKNSYLINVARGGHLVDKDLIEMLNSDHLSGACLDVYHQEPLQPDHPFWRHPKIFMTPHVASVSDISSVVPQLLENYYRFQRGESLFNKVSTTRGY